MSEKIGQVTRAQEARVGDQLPAYALRSGALTTFEDGEAVFTGNGVNTPAQVADRLIQIEAEKDKSLSVFTQGREAGIFVARQSLELYNPHLKNQNAEEAVPEGQQFYSRVGMDLKAMLAPYKENLGALRELVASGATGLGGKSVATGHGVFSEGRRLPTGGEPPPVMDEAAVLARLGAVSGD
jgi:hypothetical protein